jgi:hypothetical protein
MRYQIESVQIERRLVMIPASYLYKEAYKQHWGEDFARRTGEAPWEAHPEAGLWEKPSLWRRLGQFFGGAFGATEAAGVETRTSGQRCPEAADRRTVLPA